MPTAKERMKAWIGSWTDIQDHIPTLYRYARGQILELGVRSGVSTSALLAGVEENGGHVFSVDINPKCSEVFRGHPNWTFICSDSCDHFRIWDEGRHDGFGYPLDMVFIDTEHTYERLSGELAIWGAKVKRGGLIVIHDVERFPDMARAAMEWARERERIYEVHQGSNGLGVIYA
jgi:predicted O-methyltransferase YrrM